MPVPGKEEYLGDPGGPLSLFDAETFRKAGLTPYAEIKAKFGEDYTALVTDSVVMRQNIDASQLRVVIAKCEYGGRIKLAKEMTAHGGKGNVPRDFQVDDGTATSYVNGYTYFPWAYPKVVKKAAADRAAGKEPVFPLKDIIEVGKAEARAAGAIDTRPTYFGPGKVYLVDSAKGSGEFVDLPHPFPGTKKKGRGGVVPAHWEQVSKNGDVYTYKEVGGEAKPYFIIRSEDGKRTMPFAERVMVARISNKKELLTFTEDKAELAKQFVFDVEEPKMVSVIRIDPVRPSIERIGGGDKVSGYPRGMLDNEFMESDDSVYKPLNGEFEGLTLVQSRSRNDNPVADDGEYQFGMRSKEYSGTCYIVRLGEGKRLAPLDCSLSVSDVASRVTFFTYDMIAKAKGQEPKYPDFDFEVMDDERWQDYLDFDGKADIYPYLYAEWKVYNTYRADALARDYEVLKVVAGQPAWKITALRDIVERQKTAMAEAEAAKVKAEADAKAAEEEAVDEADEAEPVETVEAEAVDETVETEPVIDESVSSGGFPDPDTTEPDEPVIEKPVSSGGFPDPNVDATKPDEPIEIEILEPDYRSLSYGEQEHADRKLVDAIRGALDSIERNGLAIISDMGEVRATVHELRDRLRVMLRVMVDTAKAAHDPVDTLAEHLEHHKGADPKVTILSFVKRSQPHVTMDEILSCYVETPTGKVQVFNGHTAA